MLHAALQFRYVEAVRQRGPFEFGQEPLPLDVQFEEDGSTDWVSVGGGRLEVPIAVRVSRLPDSRLVITGLMISTDDQTEVTTSTLRSIRLGALAEQLAAYIAAHPHDQPGGRWTPEWRRWQHVRAVVGNSPAVPLGPRKRGVPPTDDELRTFAAVYEEELSLRPRRAMAETTKRLYIERTTGYRWAALCRERGYLPPKEES